MNMVRYNPITGEEVPSYQTHAGHPRRGEVEEQASASSSSTSPSDVSVVDNQEDKVAASIDDDKSTSLETNTFEDMVAAEMERLRLEHGEDDGAVKAKKDDDAAAEVPAASSIAPSVGSNHHHHHHHQQHQQHYQRKQIVSSQSVIKPAPHNSQSVSTSLLGRDEGQELATRRQRAREYGEQLRLQMEEDRLAKMSGREDDDGGMSPASTCAETSMVCQKESTIENDSMTRPSDAVTSGASYGELLRLQMKEDGERRRKQREDNGSGLVAKASIDTIGNSTNSTAASKELKAMEYRRQLDEQIATKSVSYRASKSSGTDSKETEEGQLDFKSNQAVTSDRKKKKDEYAQQLREQMDAKAARRQRSTLAPESSSNASSVLTPWHLGEDREAQERQQRRSAALEQQQLLELQIQEQNEAKARMKKEEENSALPSQATDEAAVAPIEEPRRPPDTSDDCPLLAAESSFIPTPKLKIRRNADEYTTISQNDVPICPMKSPVIRRGKGGEAFTVSLDDATEGPHSGVTSVASPTIPSCVSGVPANSKAICVPANSKAIKSSPCRRSRSKSKSATASSVRRPPLEPPVSPSEGTQDSVVDEDDVLVQGILRSVLRRIEDNVPTNDKGSQEVDTNGPQKKKTKKSVQFRALEASTSDQHGNPSVPIEKRDAHLPNGSDEYVDALEEPFQVVGDEERKFVVPPTSVQTQLEAYNFDDEPLFDYDFEVDEHFDDDEEVEEEKLMQALSRIRNSMDTSFAST